MGWGGYAVWYSAPETCEDHEHSEIWYGAALTRFHALLVGVLRSMLISMLWPSPDVL